MLQELVVEAVVQDHACPLLLQLISAAFSCFTHLSMNDARSQHNRTNPRNAKDMADMAVISYDFPRFVVKRDYP